ncbi:2610_t:CDS:2 [Funneliformis geosporum]|uniref:2610_t:CDS:1 n=1 Tax=Funneliformis geosporum TaxID=1117311 RepID=A0A9W4SJP9_9GLOM|nr:2610_t:CDS:2 [Funneliformis geosporum]
MTNSFVKRFDSYAIQILCSEEYASNPKLSNEKDGKPLRPPNSFFQFKNTVKLYSQDQNLMVGQTCLCNDRNILTKVAGELWHFCLNPDQKIIFSDLFKLAKLDHEKRFPDYKYKPKRTKSDFKFSLESHDPVTEINNDQQIVLDDQHQLFSMTDISNEITERYLVPYDEDIQFFFYNNLIN